jgi:hypothetical protein
VRGLLLGEAQLVIEFLLGRQPLLRLDTGIVFRLLLCDPGRVLVQRGLVRRLEFGDLCSVLGLRLGDMGIMCGLSLRDTGVMRGQGRGNLGVMDRDTGRLSRMGCCGDGFMSVGMDGGDPLEM